VTLNSSTVGLTLGAALTMSGTFTFTQGTVTLQTFTLTCSYFTSSNSNARTIAFGTGNITVTGSNTPVWNTDTSTNLTVTGTPVVNATYSGSVGTRTLIFGSTSAPTEANSISVNVSAGSDALTMYGAGFRDINFTGFSGTWNSNGGNRTVYGSLTLSAGMTIASGFGTIIFAATSGTKTITVAGQTIQGNLTFNGAGGTFGFTDALTLGTTRVLTITNGTVKLKAGTTNTVGSFATGAGTTQRFLQSTVAGSAATISDASGTNTVTYLTIQDSAATGGATWSAPTGSGNVDAGNNTGWYFSATSSGLSRGTGLYVGSSGLYKGSKGLYGGNSGLDN